MTGSFFIAVPSDGKRSPRELRNRRIVFSLLLLVGLCGAAILHRFDPTPHPGERHFYPVCLFHKYTGLYCPGCGTTRGLHALLHGRVLTAVRYNALTILIGVPVVGWAFLRYGINAVFPRVRLPQGGSMRTSQAIGVVVILFSVLRNLPYAPFSYLAPPEPAQAEPKVGLRPVGRGERGAGEPADPLAQKKGAAPLATAPVIL